MTGRTLRTVLGVILLAMVVGVIVMNHIVRDRVPGFLDVVFYALVLGSGIAMIHLETAVVLMRGARKLLGRNGHASSMGHTMTGIPRLRDPRDKEQP